MIKKDISEVVRLLATSKSIYDSNSDAQSVVQAFTLYHRAYEISSSENFSFFSIVDGLHYSNMSTWSITMEEVASKAEAYLISICKQYEC